MPALFHTPDGQENYMPWPGTGEHDLNWLLGTPKHRWVMKLATGRPGSNEDHEVNSHVV